MLERFKWYRRWKGGNWYKLYYPAHYLHAPYTKWTQDGSEMVFPFYGKLETSETYPRKYKYK